MKKPSEVPGIGHGMSWVVRDEEESREPPPKPYDVWVQETVAQFERVSDYLKERHPDRVGQEMDVALIELLSGMDREIKVSRRLLQLAVGVDEPSLIKLAKAARFRIVGPNGEETIPTTPAPGNAGVHDARASIGFEKRVADLESAVRSLLILVHQRSNGPPPPREEPVRLDIEEVQDQLQSMETEAVSQVRRMFSILNRDRPGATLESAQDALKTLQQLANRLPPVDGEGEG